MECQSQESHQSLLTTSVLSFPRPTIRKPVYVILVELSSASPHPVFPPTIWKWRWRTMVFSISNQHQRTPILLRSEMFTSSLLTPTEKCAVLTGISGQSFRKLSYRAGASFNFLILTNWLNKKKNCLHVGWLLGPCTTRGTGLPKCKPILALSLTRCTNLDMLCHWD